MWWLKTTTTYFSLSLYFRNLNRDQLTHSSWHWCPSPMLLIQLVAGMDWKLLEGFTPTSGSLCSFMWFSLSPHGIITFIYQSWAYFYLQHHGCLSWTKVEGVVSQNQWRFKGRELASPLKGRELASSLKGRELASPLKGRDSKRGMRGIVRVLFWRSL